MFNRDTKRDFQLTANLQASGELSESYELVGSARGRGKGEQGVACSRPEGMDQVTGFTVMLCLNSHQAWLIQ